MLDAVSQHASEYGIAPGTGSPLRGLSVEYLCLSFLDEVAAAGYGRNSTVKEVEEKVIRGRGARLLCPRDGRPGAAYADCVPDGAAQS